MERHVLPAVFEFSQYAFSDFAFWKIWVVVVVCDEEVRWKRENLMMLFCVVSNVNRKEEMAISVIGSRLADQHATETERLNEQMEKMRAVIQATSVMLDDVGVFVERSRTEGPSGENGVGDVGVDDDDLIRAADEAERASRGEKNVSGSASSVVTGENGSKGSGRGRSVGAKES